MRADGEVVILDDEVTDRRGRHVQPQVVPVIAVVEREPDLRLTPREQQSLPPRVFLHRVDVRAVGDAAHDLRPALAAVLGPVDVRTQIVEMERVDCGIGLVGVRVRRVHDRDLGPRHERGWRDIGPRLAPVARDLDQPVVRASPNGVRIHGARREGVDHAAPRRRSGRCARIATHDLRNFPRLAREIGTDLLPAVASIDRLPHDVGAEIEFVLVRG